MLSNIVSKQAAVKLPAFFMPLPPDFATLVLQFCYTNINLSFKQKYLPKFFIILK
jgi:hypothetical protein